MGNDFLRGAVLGADAQALFRKKTRQLIRTPWFAESERDDIKQDLTLHVLKNINNFDSDRGSIGAFINRIVESHTAMMLRDRKRQKRAAGFYARSIDLLPENQTHDPVSGAAAISEADGRRRLGLSGADTNAAFELRASVMQVMAGLPRDLADLCVRLSNGTIASVARDLNISRRQVSNRMAEASKYFVAAGLDEF